MSPYSTLRPSQQDLARTVELGKYTFLPAGSVTDEEGFKIAAFLHICYQRTEEFLKCERELKLNMDLEWLLAGIAGKLYVGAGEGYKEYSPSRAIAEAKIAGIPEPAVNWFFKELGVLSEQDFPLLSLTTSRTRKTILTGRRLLASVGIFAGSRR